MGWESLEGDDAETAVVGEPVAVAVETGAGEVFDAAQELGLLGFGDTIEEAAAEHVEPVAEAGDGVVEFGGTVKDFGEADFEAGFVEDFDVSGERGVIPGRFEGEAEFLAGLEDGFDDAGAVPFSAEFGDEASAGAEGAFDGAGDVSGFGNPVQSGVREDQVEGRREGEVAGVADLEGVLGVDGAGLFDHGGGRIEAGDEGAVGGERVEEFAGAAA